MAGNSSVSRAKQTSAQHTGLAPLRTATHSRGVAASCKSKIVAGVLAILLGWLGVHHFYLGSTSAGLIMLLVSVLSCFTLSGITWLIGLVEGILLLVMPDEDFDAKYNDRSPEGVEFVFQNKHK